MRGILKDLGDGLIMRRGRVEDAENLAEFNVRIHCENDPGAARFVGPWTKDLMSGEHPTTKARDFTIVEDTRTGKIASSLCLISQTWSYGGVQFGLGRPELVGTDPQYRNRRLVKEQFDVIHEWSRQRGELAQAITGIAYFYRQFGYEMTLDLGGYRQVHVSQVPVLGEKEAEPYHLRPTTEEDTAFLVRTYRVAMTRYAVSCARPPGSGGTSGRGGGGVTVHTLVIEKAGRRVGLLADLRYLLHSGLQVLAYEMAPGSNWLEATPSVLRYLKQKTKELAAQEKAEAEWLFFTGSEEHPVYDILGHRATPAPGTYSFYMRVPDLPVFARHVARGARSTAGELRGRRI